MNYCFSLLVVLAACSGAATSESSDALGDPCVPPTSNSPGCGPLVGTPAFKANGGVVTPGSIRCVLPDGTTWDFIGQDKVHYVTAQDPPGFSTLLCYITPDGGK